ncbi:MAG: S-layer homology domain-containing protein [Candidatus Margulisbacteria bacterium]|nr:S-layer homology domain-containing protein [Candidatus Margulisiibacteriota bacterium]
MARVLMVWLVALATVVGAEQAPAVNIQTAMTTADMAGFGRITPFAVEHIGNVLVNPASIGGLPFYQLALSTYQVSSEFDYRHVSVAFPHKGWVWGISLGTNVTGGFIETAYVDEVVYDIGSFSAGFDVLHAAWAKKSNEPFFFIDHFYYGFGISAFSQVIGSKRRPPSYGLDMGLIATSLTDVGLLNRVDVGVSAVNALSTPLPAWDLGDGKSDKQLMERQLYAGVSIDAFNYMTSGKFGVYAQGFAVREVMGGVEFNVSRGLRLRASTTYDMYQSGEFVYHLGTGIQLNRVAGFGQSIYNLAFDYTYTIYPFPRIEDPSHTVSVSFLGESTDRRPTVLSPKESYATLASTADFNGSSDRNATIYIYNGSRLVGQTTASNMGKWRVTGLSLDPGYNTITFRSKSDIHDLSKASLPIVVHLDNEAPKLTTNINIVGDQVLVELTSNEPLKRAEMVSGNSRVAFKKRNNHQYDLLLDLPSTMTSGSPLPEEMLTYDIIGIDGMGNQSPTQSVSFFVKALFPSDQSVVYSDAITVLGHASPDVQSIRVNGRLIETDKNNAFSNSVQLNYGKQLVVVTVQTTNGEQLNYIARLICMRRFDDIPKTAKYRRDIEFLATLGFIDGKEDGLFHPNEVMTRRDVTLAIAKQKNLTPKTLDYDPFLDVPKSDPDAGLISAAVDAGITFAFADGTFKPNGTVSVADAFKMLNNSGVIDSEDIVVTKTPIKRYEFALFFKQVRRYDQRVLYLMDWEQGYNIPN